MKRKMLWLLLVVVITIASIARAKKHAVEFSAFKIIEYYFSTDSGYHLVFQHTKYPFASK